MSISFLVCVHLPFHKSNERFVTNRNRLCPLRFPTWFSFSKGCINPFPMGFLKSFKVAVSGKVTQFFVIDMCKPRTLMKNL